MTALDVLRAMSSRYAAMRSYQDRGIVLTKSPDHADTNETIFATAFRRPDRFRFEWTTHHPYPPLRHLRTRHVIWNDCQGTFYFNDLRPAVEPQASLRLAIAGATGVSRGSAHTVPALLIPEVGGFTLPQLQRLTLAHDQCEGTRCYRITGHHPAAIPPANSS
jgi:hypothetical protein